MIKGIAILVLGLYILTDTSSAPVDGGIPCQYKNQTYSEGDTWIDGCDYNCTCVNGSIGSYSCSGLCPIWGDMPDGCVLNKPPGECCETVDCSGGSTQDSCPYKNNSYSQGETWKDGCEFRCTCVDASKGATECKGLCLQWTLPEVCQLLPPPAGKCCEVPSCPEGVQLQFPEGYVQE